MANEKRLIDANALKGDFMFLRKMWSGTEIMAVIDEAQTVEVLPCKVGQELWVVYTPKHPANPNDKGKWFMVQDGVQRIIFGAKGVSIETWNMGTIPEKEIGKKLFFVREDAEVALRERKDNENP